MPANENPVMELQAEKVSLWHGKSRTFFLQPRVLLLAGIEVKMPC